jgi:hypothetical protein
MRKHDLLSSASAPAEIPATLQVNAAPADKQETSGNSTDTS